MANSEQQPANYAAGSSPISASLGDLNGDGKLDLVVVGGTAYIVLLSNGNGTFKSPLSSTFSPPPSAVAIGDFNHDGKADLALTGNFP
jgi:hypothetical protein